MKAQRVACIVAASALVCAFLAAPRTLALGSQQNPQSSSVGLEATIPGAPPSQAATIAVPSTGQVFTSTPITVSGLCKTDLLVKLFSNDVFIGAVTCANGSYSLKADLFSGRNDLVAKVFDALDQQGPDSNVVSVTFNDAQFAQFGTHVTLSSNYARIGADPNAPLTLPLIVSAGRAPYALSIDWGDGNGNELKTVPFAGIVTLTHTYTQAGVYTIVAKATDSNDTSAYLQVVGVANGKISGGLTSPGSSTTITRNVVLWQPLLAVIPLLLLAFWLGQRYELFTIRRTIEASREDES